MAVLVYIVAIVAVNYGFSVVPMLPTPWGDMFPPMTFAVGLIFVLRDYAQRQVGHWVLAAMLVAGALSYIMADPFVAVASVTAFALAELTDWGVYSFTGRPFRQRVLISSAVSTPIDSAVFLSMIGAFSWSGMAAMFAAKMAAALIVWRIAR